jgi:hypothetical protein
MAVTLKDMKCFKSTSGLGGAITAAALLSQAATLSASLSGVTVADAADNALGSGTLRFDASEVAFYYTPPSGSEGSATVVSGTGEVIVRGAGNTAGYVRLSITFGSLPVSDQTRTVTVANDANELFDDVTKAEALAGSTEYRCFYLENEHATDGIDGAAIWIYIDAVGGDSVAIGLDPAGVGATGATIANETTPPAGVTFSNPTTEAGALIIPAMTAGQSIAIWVRRTVPAVTSTAVADDYSWLRFRILV